MEIKRFTNSFLKTLMDDSHLSTRKRQNHNIHTDYRDSCQRLFNAIGFNSYIPPHRHSLDPVHECLIAVSGLFALFIFENNGNIMKVSKFGSEIYRNLDEKCDAGVEIPPDAWHTVIALSDSAVLFEVKAGPFNPLLAKEVAPWAPMEGDQNALNYLKELRGLA